MKTWPSQSASSKGGSSTRRSDRSRVILGIDPGSRFMGFGAVRVGTSGYQVVSYGVIAPPAGLAFNDRLAILADEFAALLE